MAGSPKYLLIILLLLSFSCRNDELKRYNVVWTSMSKNASESMPCGGGSIGLNVWVEDGDILFYLSQSGTFDENNTFLKPGRFRIQLPPNTISNESFKQELNLKDGSVYISSKSSGNDIRFHIWVDVNQPVVYLEMESKQALPVTAAYENWRYIDRKLTGRESFGNSYKWAMPSGLTMKRDSICFSENGILAFHRNTDPTIFDVTVRQQKMDTVKSEMYNPLKNLTFGVLLKGKGMEPAGSYSGKYADTNFQGWKLKSTGQVKKQSLQIAVCSGQYASLQDWQKQIKSYLGSEKTESIWAENCRWWNDFWNRSFVFIRPEQENQADSVWQCGRNYQLFRYMLACNAYGSFPTKFNGGLFSVDPSYTDTIYPYSPDFRKWGGGTSTAQNQRLVYYPMLKNGDFDLLKVQLDFYRRILKNAELRSQVYWKHGGACFTEQIENFGLPNCSEYGWNRPENYDPGMEYNKWLEYQWDTSLEFCDMALQLYEYTGQDISKYVPLVISCLQFFEEHYQFLARQRGESWLDGEGRFVLYPGSACETYKIAKNASSTISALRKVCTDLLSLPKIYLTEPERQHLTAFFEKLPEISFREIEGHKMIAPAQEWERINNTEAPQLYPVFPWGDFGVGKPNLEIARNTWYFDPDVIRFKSHVGWKQYNIFAARLGLTEAAAALCLKKMADSGRRFPAFWGPGFDWTPDHNWGGSGMIGIQEMLMQTDGEKIYLLPAWPASWDVHFKLTAPQNTTVEVRMENGEIVNLNVEPESRKKDIINSFQKN